MKKKTILLLTTILLWVVIAVILAFSCSAKDTCILGDSNSETISGGTVITPTNIN